MVSDTNIFLSVVVRTPNAVVLINYISQGYVATSTKSIGHFPSYYQKLTNKVGMGG